MTFRSADRNGTGEGASTIADVSGLPAALSDKQDHSAVLDATTESFTTAMLSKLNAVGNAVIPIALLEIDLSLGRFFEKSISADSAFTFANVPQNVAIVWSVTINVTGDRVITFPSNRPNSSATYTLTPDRTHKYIFFSNGNGVIHSTILKDYLA